MNTSELGFFNESVNEYATPRTSNFSEYDGLIEGLNFIAGIKPGFKPCFQAREYVSRDTWMSYAYSLWRRNINGESRQRTVDEINKYVELAKKATIKLEVKSCLKEIRTALINAKEGISNLTGSYITDSETSKCLNDAENLCVKIIDTLNLKIEGIDAYLVNADSVSMPRPDSLEALNATFSQLLNYNTNLRNKLDPLEEKSEDLELVPASSNNVETSLIEMSDVPPTNLIYEPEPTTSENSTLKKSLSSEFSTFSDLQAESTSQPEIFRPEISPLLVQEIPEKLTSNLTLHPQELLGCLADQTLQLESEEQFLRATSPQVSNPQIISPQVSNLQPPVSVKRTSEQVVNGSLRRKNSPKSRLSSPQPTPGTKSFPKNLKNSIVHGLESNCLSRMSLETSAVGSVTRNIDEIRIYSRPTRVPEENRINFESSGCVEGNCFRQGNMEQEPLERRNIFFNIGSPLFQKCFPEHIRPVPNRLNESIFSPSPIRMVSEGSPLLNRKMKRTNSCLDFLFPSSCLSHFFPDIAT